MLTALRTSTMSWLGIAGGILTIFSNLQGVLDLAKWASWLAEVWAYYVVGFWRAVFSAFGIRVDPNSSMMICMAAFVTLIALAARLENDYWGEHSENWPVSYRRVLNWRVAAALVIYLALSIVTYYVYFIPGLREVYINHAVLFVTVAYAIYGTAIVMGLRGWPLPIAIWVAFCMAALSYVFGNAPMRRIADASVSGNLSEFLAIAFAILSGFAVLVVAPPKAFSRRLVYMLVGVALLVALSEVSSFNIAVTAPPLN